MVKTSFLALTLNSSGNKINIIYVKHGSIGSLIHSKRFPVRKGRFKFNRNRCDFCTAHFTSILGYPLAIHAQNNKCFVFNSTHSEWSLIFTARKKNPINSLVNATFDQTVFMYIFVPSIGDLTTYSILCASPVFVVWQQINKKYTNKSIACFTIINVLRFNMRLVVANE